MKLEKSVIVNCIETATFAVNLLHLTDIGLKPTDPFMLSSVPKTTLNGESD